MGSNKPLETILRPKKLKDYIGQDKVVKALKLFIDAVVSRGEVSEHILLYGPPGIGKTTLANIMALELKGDLKITSGPAIEKTGDLAAILTNLKDNDVLFIDEIHRLPKPVEEAFYPVMEEFFLDIILGKGPAARTVRLPIPRITIIGATTRVALLSAPLRDRFGLLLRLDFYNREDMKKIIKRSAQLLNLPIVDEALDAIVQRCRRTPRIANRILKRIRDSYEVNKHETIDSKVLDELFDILQIDNCGLTNIDRKYLKTLIKKHNGGPIGLSTIASALSEDKQTIEEYIEPYLLQLGFIRKTPKGRVVTRASYKHFGLPFSRNQIKQDTLV